MVAEIGQRVAQGREFPVEYGQHARRLGVEHEVVEPVVPVHDGDQLLVARHDRDVLRQPLDQPVHLGDGLGDRGDVLLAPAADLAFEVVAGLAEVGQPNRGEIDAVKGGQHPVHFEVDGSALWRRHARQGLVPQHAAFHVLHHVEGAADHGFIFAQHVHQRHGHCGAVEAAHDLEFALDGMCRGQQAGHGAGLGAHHILTRRRDQAVGRVGLAARKFLDLQRPFESGQVPGEPMLQRLDVDRVGGGAVGIGHGRERAVAVSLRLRQCA